MENESLEQANEEYARLSREYAERIQVWAELRVVGEREKMIPVYKEIFTLSEQLISILTFLYLEHYENGDLEKAEQFFILLELEKTSYRFYKAAWEGDESELAKALEDMGVVKAAIRARAETILHPISINC